MCKPLPCLSRYSRKVEGLLSGSLSSMTNPRSGTSITANFKPYEAVSPRFFSSGFGSGKLVDDEIRIAAYRYHYGR